MGIENLAEKSLSELSGGTVQKVYLAMILAQQTSVILMDEPTANLDVAHQKKVMEEANDTLEDCNTNLQSVANVVELMDKLMANAEKLQA
jgi:iron complex transport system ATP-binding protein